MSEPHQLRIYLHQPLLDAAANHRPDFARYLYWFLQQHAINMSAPDASVQIAAALRRGGWPVRAPD